MQQQLRKMGAGWRRAGATLVTAAVLATTCPQLAWSQADPALQQQVAATEEIVPPGVAVTVSAGHMDLGPRGGTEFTLSMRDDSTVPPVWRDLSDVVFRIGDNALQTIPEGAAGKEYEFTGAEPGQALWVIPQTQQIGVPWLGWNTQAPSLLDLEVPGVTLEFTGHSGPGTFSMFLQSGGFGAPTQLWNSAAATPQPVWVESGNHTHANWTFSAPGVHLVQVTARAQTATGQELVDTQILRFAVGDSTDEAAARTAEFHPQAAPASNQLPLLLAAAAAGVLLLLGVLLWLRKVK